MPNVQDMAAPAALAAPAAEEVEEAEEAEEAEENRGGLMATAQMAVTSSFMPGMAIFMP